MPCRLQRSSETLFSLHVKPETHSLATDYALGIGARHGIAPPTPPHAALQTRIFVISQREGRVLQHVFTFSDCESTGGAAGCNANGGTPRLLAAAAIRFRDRHQLWLMWRLREAELSH